MKKPSDIKWALDQGEYKFLITGVPYQQYCHECRLFYDKAAERRNERWTMLVEWASEAECAMLYVYCPSCADAELKTTVKV